VKIIFALFLVLLLLVELFTGKAFTNSPHWLKVRQSERPGAWMWWGSVWVRRSEDPRKYWMTIIGNCVMILLFVLLILHKPQHPQTIAKIFIECWVGVVCCLIIGIFFNWLWKPSRREVFGIGSPRTIALYSACVVSIPAILILNLKMSFQLGFLFFVPFLLMILAMMSARKDPYQ
jgi:type IV secretory pathway TrbD component